MADTDPRKDALAAAPSMEPVQGTVEVDIPIDVLWSFFTRANLWSRWNGCFLWALNQELVLGQQLVWAFKAIRWWYPYNMPAIAQIVELEPTGPERKVTWSVTALPGFYARHTYHMEDLGGGRTRFGSDEKAMGWSFQLMKGFWLAHFTFVKDRSLEGAKQTLEPAYRQAKRLDETAVKGGNPLAAALKLLLVALLLGVGAGGTWFYLSFGKLRAVALAPGVHAVLGGGSNTLVVEGRGATLLVDPKFPPGSQQLGFWIRRHVKSPVTRIVNTHYHYDHVLGDELFPGAQVIAHRTVGQLLGDREPDMVRDHPRVVPTEQVGDAPEFLAEGEHEIVLSHLGPGHTRGDLVVYLPKEKILATGDVFFFTYYPFFDLGEGGAELGPMIQVLRKLARDYPDATVMPGHGPMARMADLSHYADYLEFLHTQAQECLRKGLSEDEAVKAIDASAWHLSVLPSFHRNELTWATATSNARAAYRLVKKERLAAGP